MMKTVGEIVQEIGQGGYDGAFTALYPGTDTESCRKRYQALLEMFKAKFGDHPVVIVSAPRTRQRRGRAVSNSARLWGM